MKGLVIGKFYPPHKGHSFLINQALSQVERLVVILCTKSNQTIPAELRVEWLQKMHPQIEVRVLDLDVFNNNSPQAWATAVLALLGNDKLDCMFTSEVYGNVYAPLLGMKHVLVDLDRKHVPVSARAIRENPLKYAEYLDPFVLAYFQRS